MVHPNCWCLTFWLSLIAFTAAQNHAEPSSVQELQAYSLFIEDVCVYLYQIAVCSTSIPIWSGVTYSIMAGFAQGTRSYACLKPKWRENWSVPKGSSLDMIFKLKKDYCIYSRSATPDHDVLLTCINTCYDGGPIQNPSFYRSFGEIGYDQAKWDNPDHGTYNDRYPEKCKRFQADQNLLQSTTECPQPSSSAFNNPGTTNPETATAENVDDLYQQTLPPGTTNPETATAENVDNPYQQTPPYIGSNPALPANPIFNDHTGNSNIFSFAPLDMGTLSNARISEGTEAQTQDAQTQDWLTNLFRDPKEFSILTKRARKSPRDFR